LYLLRSWFFYGPWRLVRFNVHIFILDLRVGYFVLLTAMV
jgi:hypothetical protein